jgi:hypothetical protein
MKEANSIKSFEIRWCWLNENEITASTACACGLLAGRALFSLEIMQRGTAFAFDEAKRRSSRQLQKQKQLLHCQGLA